MKSKIKICLTEEAQVILPQLGIDPNKYTPAYNGESTGLDLYNMGPELIILGRNKWSVYGEQQVEVPTGIRIKIPENCVGLIKDRGSIVKSGLITRAGVIDPGYMGEIFVYFVNVGERDTKITPGAKLPVQLIVVECNNSYETVTYSDYVSDFSSSNRKENKVGSTD